MTSASNYAEFLQKVSYYVSNIALGSLKPNPNQSVLQLSIISYSLWRSTTVFALSFLDQQDPVLLIFTATTAGTLVLLHDWPTVIKQKHCYFIKKSPDNVVRGRPMSGQVYCGDLSSSPVEQLSTFVDEVGDRWDIALFARRHTAFPHVRAWPEYCKIYSFKADFQTL